MWGWTSLERFAQDLRYAARTMRKDMAFTLIAVLSLGLGVGSATAIFSVIHAVLIDPFPYKDVANILSVNIVEPGKAFGRGPYYTPEEWLDLAEGNHVFSEVGASTINDVIWLGNGDPERLRGSYVTGDTFKVYGVPALIGRTSDSSDVRPDATPVAVLGYKFWQKRFAGKPDVLGRQLLLNGVKRTVIGVMPIRFGLRGADVYLPVQFVRGGQNEASYPHFAARAKPGVTIAQIEADIYPIIAEMARKKPKEFPEKWRIRVDRFSETFASDLRETLLSLFGAVGLLLLIACANVSNLLLARGTAREKELALRVSLGAGRARIIRQLLTESLVLALLGGMLGVLLAFFGLRGILALMPPLFIPTESEVTLNAPVLMFSLALSLLAVLVFGLAPAFASSRSSVADSLKEASKGAGGSDRKNRLRTTLAAVEIALSLMLLVGASLMFRTLISLQSLALPFDPSKMLTLSVPISRQHYTDAAKRSAFFTDLLERVRRVPGVRAASLNLWLPGRSSIGFPMEVVGGSRQDGRSVSLQQVDSEYLRTLGISLRQGRMFTRAEVRASRQVGLVNETFVRRYLPDGSVLGRIVRIPALRLAPVSLADDSFELIGVVQDTPNAPARVGIQPEMYVPHTITGFADYLAISTSVPPLSIANAVRAQVYEIDRNQPVTRVQTMEQALTESEYARPRFSLVLFGVFAAVGLSLALIGVGGVIAYMVVRRTQEFGVRLALGAHPSDILALVLGSGMRLIGVGILLGLIGSVSAAGLIRNMIWGVSAWDPWSFGAVALVLVGTGVLACWWPAQRAARVDPIVALRYE